MARYIDLYEKGSVPVIGYNDAGRPYYEWITIGQIDYPVFGYVNKYKSVRDRNGKFVMKTTLSEIKNKLK